MQQDIARETGERLRVQLTDAEKALLTKQATHNFRAYELVQRADDNRLWTALFV